MNLKSQISLIIRTGGSIYLLLLTIISIYQYISVINTFKSPITLQLDKVSCLKFIWYLKNYKNWAFEHLLVAHGCATITYGRVDQVRTTRMVRVPLTHGRDRVTSHIFQFLRFRHFTRKILIVVPFWFHFLLRVPFT